MNEYQLIIKKLKEIKDSGWIKTHRSGPTGIGKTLEDLLGIKENNIPSSNTHMIELKSARKNQKSMVTLFTKSPLPRGANSIILERFGYPSSRKEGTKRLETTVNAINFNNIKNNVGFKIDINNNIINLIDINKEILGYWDYETLKNSFEQKLPNLLYVKAETKGTGSNEEFWYNEAWLLNGFNFDNFIKLLSDGIILVDIRIGQYPNGKIHDHGTGFRIFPDKFDLCFNYRQKIM
ncbi:MAG TPA: MvaI/BcnI family restriction endonuclease [Bacteroidales bacterium]|nr:MvaI/BcnI family restriction endonuclease [Bacteroidales bacterium]